MRSVDDALSGEEHPALAAIDGDQTIHISSLSKCLSPGVRLGVLVAPETVMSSLHNALIALHWTGPSFWVEVFEFMRENGSAERCLTAHRREAARRLELYAEIVRERPATSLPSYHVWQRVPAPWRVDDFAAELLAVGVRVSPGQHFAIAQNVDNNFIRVCLGCSDDADALREQLSRLGAVMHSRPRLSATII